MRAHGVAKKGTKSERNEHAFSDLDFAVLHPRMPTSPALHFTVRSKTTFQAPEADRNLKKFN